MRTNKALLFVRSTGGATAINKQVRVLREYADDHGIKIVGTVTLPHCDATDFEVQSHLAAMLGVRRGRKRANLVVIKDLSHLSHHGVAHAMHFIKKLATVGIAVVMPDLGVVTEKLWSSFPLLRKRWARPRRRAIAFPDPVAEVPATVGGSAAPEEEQQQVEAGRAFSLGF